MLTFESSKVNNKIDLIKVLSFNFFIILFDDFKYNRKKYKEKNCKLFNSNIIKLT